MSEPLKKISTLLDPQAIQLELQAQNKLGALREVAGLLAEKKCIGRFETFYQEILERERISNTALGHDIAIPHARTDQCSEIVVAVGRSRQGINFEGKDAQPVRLIFLVGTPKAMVTEYLRFVGTLARLLRQDDLRQALLAAPDTTTFIQLIAQAEP
jgi:mannitol/fructose-specific phosphotransferase system IIA component (Ntr-type)